MKTKVLIVAVIILFFYTGSIAQCLYTAGQTISGNGFTYICHDKMEGAGILLCNKNNKLTFVDEAMKDGSQFKGWSRTAPNPYDYTAGTSTDFVMSVLKLAHKILASDIAMTQGEFLMVRMFINSDTGEIDEVNFHFTLFKNKWCRIAPEKYFALEQAIKSQYRFNITDQGRKYNYNLAWIPIKYFDSLVPKPKAPNGSGSKMSRD